jgi:predicted amidophosphoribosyltransferase
MQYAFEAAIALGELSGVLARAVVLHKDAGERRLGAVLGGLVGECVAASWGRAWADAVCWIPPTAAAIARRGFDHGSSLAAPTAEHLGVPVSGLLVRRRAKDQRTMGRTQRQASAEGSFSVAAGVPSRVLLVDDVLTTGATLDAAAQTLLSSGATTVRAAVVARAW